MRLILRSLLVAAFLGSLYWIRRQPQEPEPYISTILAVASLLGTFFESQRRESRIVPRLIQKRSLKEGGDARDNALIVHNDGDEEVFDFELKLVLGADQKSPVWDSTRQPTDKVAVPVIHAGQRFEWIAVFLFRAPTEFDAIWNWRTKRGRKEERRGRLKLEAMSGIH